MGVLLDALRMVDFLHGATDDTLDEVLVAGRCVDLMKGHIVWRRGGAPEGIIVPVTGEAKTLGRGPDGREFIERFVGPGEWMGLQSSLDGLPHPADGEVTRTGTFFRLDRAALSRIFDAHPEIRANATQSVGLLYRQNVRDLEDMALRPVSQRLAKFLIDHACIRQTDGAKVLLHATQAEVAARLGTVREVVARSLGEFAAEGLIARTPHGIFIDDWAGMRAVAGEEGGQDAPGATPPPPNLRTARFFLPLAERWSRQHEPESSGCREHLGDLVVCARNGCPSARDAVEKERVAAAVRVEHRSAKRSPAK